MSYKYKPSKSMRSRFKVTGTGKIKRRHTMNSHLRSRRDANRKRRLGKPAIMFEGHAKNLRRFMGVSAKNPVRLQHERNLAEQQGGEAKSE